MSAQKRPYFGLSSKNSQGFILFEVLVAMSMILGVWMGAVEVYHRLALNLAQQECRRVQLRRELDTFEIQEKVRTSLNLPSQGFNSEPARVSGRNRSMRTSWDTIGIPDWRVK